MPAKLSKQKAKGKQTEATDEGATHEEQETSPPSQRDLRRLRRESAHGDTEEAIEPEAETTDSESDDATSGQRTPAKKPRARTSKRDTRASKQGLVSTQVEGPFPATPA
eukprot:CAMPEP_0184650204 /NCGR_PEP_ID=MMETSP0308-20130426/7733_1 /TAXON_ID=38269 /ORGANISM="Gloeochaete witrockiana, Strain SAG 46.84" /LENGTH=108 /DNA_ID=CAMNT_0027083571 /DNA_START=365 /DNA_END=688 /DNA_ORIENTATION=-